MDMKRNIIDKVEAFMLSVDTSRMSSNTFVYSIWIQCSLKDIITLTEAKYMPSSENIERSRRKLIEKNPDKFFRIRKDKEEDYINTFSNSNPSLW